MVTGHHSERPELVCHVISTSTNHYKPRAHSPLLSTGIASEHCNIGRKSEVYGAGTACSAVGPPQSVNHELVPPRLRAHSRNSPHLRLATRRTRNLPETPCQSSASCRREAGTSAACRPRRTVGYGQREPVPYARSMTACKHARTTKSWMQARVQQQQTVDWTAVTPGQATHPPLSRKSCGHIAPSLRALFQLQTGSTLTDRHPKTPPGAPAKGPYLRSHPPRLPPFHRGPGRTPPRL